MKSALLKSPLIGAFLLTFLSMIYFTFSMVNLDFNHLDITLKQIMEVFNLIPLLFMIFAVISYTFFVPVGYFLFKDLQKNFRSELFFVNVAMLIAFLISLIIAYFDFQFHHLLAKSFFIVIGFSMMATTNSLYFLVLSGIIIIKDNKNDRKQGESV